MATAIRHRRGSIDPLRLTAAVPPAISPSLLFTLWAPVAELVDAADSKCALSSDVEIVVFPVALILLMITID